MTPAPSFIYGGSTNGTFDSTNKNDPDYSEVCRNEAGEDADENTLQMGAGKDPWILGLGAFSMTNIERVGWVRCGCPAV